MKVHNDLVKDMITQIKESVNTANGYYVNVKDVKRGNYMFEEMGKWPSISVSIPNRSSSSLLGGDVEGIDTFTIKIIGYANWDKKGADKLVTLHNLEDDILNFLRSSDFSTHSSKFLEVEMVDYYEGNEEDPIGEFFMMCTFYIYA